MASEVHGLVIVDTIGDGDGDKIEVGVLGPGVMLGITDGTGAVLLGKAAQERFAQAYVSACITASVNREAAKEAAADGQ